MGGNIRQGGKEWSFYTQFAMFLLAQKYPGLVASILMLRILHFVYFSPLLKPKFVHKPTFTTGFWDGV